MTRFALALVCFLVLAGCGSDLQGRMIGVWTLDIDYMQTMDGWKDAPPGDLRAMQNATQLTITDDEFEFNVSGMGRDRTDSMSYEVKEQNGDTLVVEVTGSNGKTDTVEIRFDGDTMILTGDDRGLAFRKN